MIGLNYLRASECIPPHRVTHPERVERLVTAFRDGGWDIRKPALVGYPFGGKVQLLNGAARWEAAEEVGILIPVMVCSRIRVEACYGELGYWQKLMESGGVDEEAA